MTRVVNVHKEECDVYIGRGKSANFGNPFKISKHMTREQSIEAYRDFFYKRIANDPHFVDQIESLRGKTLGCFCKPLPCHGDVIVEYLDNFGGK